MKQKAAEVRQLLREAETMKRLTRLEEGRGGCSVKAQLKGLMWKNEQARCYLMGV